MSLRALAAVVMATVMMLPHAWADTAWQSYKSRFLMPDGRIIDTGNGNVSHTEGQGFAMLLAVANNDRPTFDKLWQWTNKTLRNKDNGLFYWRYNPVAPNPVADKNNATDGDTMIAWALLRAQQQWQDSAYGTASDAITSALLKFTVVTFAGRQVMLPGAKGFYFNDHLNLNPSYFIFPAWQAFAARTHLTAWRKLQSDGQALLEKMAWGKSQLPSDWVVLNADGKMEPAKEWPARMSYDAIRIPLYVSWRDPQSRLLTPWKNWFQSYPRLQTPAWINVNTGEVAPWFMTGGLLAVRDLTLGEARGEPEITAQDDYYSASLKLLAWLANKDRQ
ncbi:glycosyl hydrolase family 8 [uncultured Klebsiella sp.]|uniref:glycosyl hydrolase family 8 n=1 Tax=uncultured Klebsiella sp. TaxID=284011 RepID=UPI0028051D37|nr:glycosyl hydrolase family 8 [uncultured Klebsiella sp.]